jgi:transposase
LKKLIDFSIGIRVSNSATTEETKAVGDAGAANFVAAIQAEVAGLKVQVAALQDTIVNLTHENVILKRRLFGNKTERTDTHEMQLTLGNLLDREKELQKELEKAATAAREAAAAEQTNRPSDPANESKPSKPKGRRDLSASSLPKVPVEIIDPVLEQQGKRIGHDVSYQLIYRRGGFAVLVRQVVKYELPTKDGSTTVLGAEVPRSIFRRGLLHESSVAHIITQKFALGVPHYRLERYLSDNRLELDRGTMCRYAEEAGNTFGATVVHAMWEDSRRNAAILSTDATGALIQPEQHIKGAHQSCKKGHFFTVIPDCDHVLFHYTEKHTQVAVEKLFSGFNALLQCDASNVYDILERGPPVDTEQAAEQGLALVGCFAHLRRYFFEAAICRYEVGIRGLTLIRGIYAVENSFGSVPPSKRKQLREAHLRPLIDQFFTWVHEAKNQTVGRNLATKALGYAVNQENELRRVLLDGRLPLDNTRSERSLRKIVVGRKSWMFYGSDVHAESAAALFSVIASCRLHQIAPEQYIEEVLRLLPYWPQERYLELAPKYWTVTRTKLNAAELAVPVGPLTIPE